MQYYGMSDIGKKRTSNQDSYTVRTLGGGALLLVVCDGMGGARGGAIAAKRRFPRLRRSRCVTRERFPRRLRMP